MLIITTAFTVFLSYGYFIWLCCHLFNYYVCHLESMYRKVEYNCLSKQ